MFKLVIKSGGGFTVYINAVGMEHLRATRAQHAHIKCFGALFLQVEGDDVIFGIGNGLPHIVPIVVSPGVGYLHFHGAESVDEFPVVGAGKDNPGDVGMLRQLDGNPRVVFSRGMDFAAGFGEEPGVRVRGVPLAGGAGKRG